MWKTFLFWLFGIEQPLSKPSDVQREASEAEPRPDVQVVGPVVRVETSTRWYFTPAMVKLLKLIGEHEGGKAGYNADYRNDDRWTLSNYTFDQVVSLSRRQVTVDKEASSAIGLYQFLTKTLLSLKESLKLKGTERFTPAFQDDLAVALMIRRGLMKYLRGELSLSGFCNNLAMEWASLPVVTATKRGNRTIKVGQSYYAGDGLNKSFHKPATVMAAVEAMGIELRKAMPKEK